MEGRSCLPIKVERRGDAAVRFSQVEIDDPQRHAPRPCTSTTARRRGFYVIEGEVTVFAGGERIDLSSGDYAFVPRGVDHAYIVRSERARMLVMFSPSGFEQFFVQEGIVADGESEPPVGGVQPTPEEFHATARALRLRGNRPAAVLSDL